jgi:hypothetical protein
LKFTEPRENCDVQKSIGCVAFDQFCAKKCFGIENHLELSAGKWCFVIVGFYLWNKLFLKKSYKGMNYHGLWGFVRKG